MSSGALGNRLISAGSISRSLPDMDSRFRTEASSSPVPNLYFIGLLFLYSLSSALLGGVGRDAKYIVDHIALKQPTTKSGNT